MKNITGFLTALLISSSIVNSQTIDSALFKAYKHNSKIILNEFFLNWENSFELSSTEFINQDDTIKELYNVLNEFYNSYVNNKASIGYNPFSETTRYFIIGDTIKYKICFSDDLPELPYWTYKIDSVMKIINNKLTGFHSFDKLGNTKILYENEKYMNSIFAFFPIQTRDIEKLTDEYEKKKDFLKGYLKIVCKGNIELPWVNKNIILSDPIINEVILNDKLDKAEIVFTMGCAGTMVKYSKQNGNWEKIKEIHLFIC